MYLGLFQSSTKAKIATCPLFFSTAIPDFLCIYVNMAWLFVLSLCFSAYFLWTAYTFFQNYRKARQLKLPILISPFNPLSPFWALFHKQLVPVLKSLPFDIAGSVRYSYVGWPFDDKYAIHQRFGDAFLVINAAFVELYIAEGEAIDAVVSRRKDFPKPVELMYRPLEVFGKNVDTVEGEEWQRHRKITTPPFNERNSGLVWKESLRQAGDLIKEWSEHRQQGVTSTSDDTMTLALHVLTSAGFGMSYSFHKTGEAELPPGHTMSYRDALNAVLRGIIPIFVFPHKWFSLPFAPKSARRLGTAIKEFRAYMTEMVAKERTMISKRDPGTGNLMSSLVRASDQAKEHALTDDEIFGNTFIYNLAGHETTANTLAYAINLLAVFPDYQHWIFEELSDVLGDQDSASAPEYEEVFPKLKRCLAIMYETLRLYGPTTTLPKYTNDKAQPLTISSEHHIIPAHTVIHLNQSAVHTLPKYWGSNSLDWLPDRWISSSAGTYAAKEPPGGKGTFVPWAEGARICPGKKFAQVEFVAVLAVLFRRWKVRPATREGESLEEARERVLRVVKDSEVVITLQMKDPGNVGLIWTERETEV
jgi:cytochrome P450